MPEVYDWTTDVEDGGVLKNHKISNKLLEQAARKFVVAPFSQKVTDFGKHMGEYVTLVYFKELDVPTSAALEEETRVPIDKLEHGTRQIQVVPMGRGVEYSTLAQDLMKFDPKMAVQKRLINQMKNVIDNTCATAFKQAKIIFIPTSLTGGTWDTDGTPSTTALVNLTLDHIATIRDYMANDLHVPFYNGETYTGLFATKALRGLKQDKVLTAWNHYLQKGDVLYRSEAGMAEQVRFVEVTNTGALSNGVGSGSVLGEGLVFGDEAVSRVEVTAPHLRVDPNYQSNFGLIKAAIWYGIIGYATTWDTANDLEAKVVRVGSA